ncbi:MAG TPA: Crp/Fnr family transcriptional regulator [candidate division Zixibacteria bacterium]|jgi:CRP/FNR family transcriptional regulator
MIKKTEIIRKIPFFSNLSENELLQISQKFIEKEFKKGGYLFWEGEPATCLYVIKTGRVKILKHSAEGKEIVLEVVTPGEICGGGAIFSETQYASARAEEKSKVYSLSRNDLLLLIRTQKDLALEVIIFLGKRLLQTHEMMIGLISGKVEKRIAALLLGLSEKHGTPVREGIKINLKLTRQDMADFVGTTVETAIRVIGRFKKMGILSSGSKEIILKNREKLKELVKGV